MRRAAYRNVHPQTRGAFKNANCRRDLLLGRDGETLRLTSAPKDQPRQIRAGASPDRMTVFYNSRNTASVKLAV
jgi:hypothetical protein